MRFIFICLFHIIIILFGGFYSKCEYYYSPAFSNQNMDGLTLYSNTYVDSPVIYFRDSSKDYIVKNCIIIKNSGITIDMDDCENGGRGAAFRVDDYSGRNITVINCTVYSNISGATAFYSTSSSNTFITDSKLISTGEYFSKALGASDKSKTIVENVYMSTTGHHSSALTTVFRYLQYYPFLSCLNCEFHTKGINSSLIYASGETDILHSYGIAELSHCIILEGKGIIRLLNSSNLKCQGIGYDEDAENSAVFIYQANFQKNNNFKSLFICRNSKIELLPNGDKYNITPAFFITNSNVDITLDNCEINNGANVFMIVSGTNFWGKSGNNGGNVKLKIINQEIQGDFIVDGISYLTINLINSTIIGSFNHDIKKPGKIDIILDPRSKLEITNESYINSILNQKSDNSNIKNYTKSDKTIRNISVKDEKDSEINKEENEKDLKTYVNIDIEANEKTKENQENQNALKNNENFAGKNEEFNSETNKGTNLQSNGDNSYNNEKYLIDISILNILFISLLFL